MRPLLISGLLALGIAAHGQEQTPAPAQSQPILIANARVHIGDGRVLARGYILFDQGRIVSVGEQAPSPLPGGTRTVEASGQEAYPGMILPNNFIGLDEVGSVRATHDYAEVGQLNPNVKAITAYNAASDVIPTLRANGVLAAQIVPYGGMASGQCALVQLDAWNSQQAALVPTLGQHINIPPRFVRDGWWAEPGATKLNEARPEQMRVLRLLLADARAYAGIPSTVRTRNLKLEAMTGLYNGSQTLFIHADAAREIEEGVLLGREMGIARLVICTGAEAVRAAGFLKSQQVPVILTRIHALPELEDNDYDTYYKAPAQLKAAGVDFCLSMEGDMEVMQGRNLGIMAGTATGFGLSEEQALEAVTAAPARILGVASRMGTLEAGKDATLILTQGSVLEPRGGTVVRAFIQGREPSLDTRQKQLARRYAQRYNIRGE